MTHPKYIAKTIRRTQRQLKKQKAKFIHSKDLDDKLRAKDEIERLRVKLVMLQKSSNNNAR